MRRNTAQGFTLIEAMIALTVTAILLAVGIPGVAGWVQAREAAAVAASYKEGFELARAKAIARHGVSRLVLTSNHVTGQPGWRVDLCLPAPAAPCSDRSGHWATLGEARLPGSAATVLTASPTGAGAVYFTPTGWIDAGIALPLVRIDLAPAPGSPGSFKPLAVVLSKAGASTVCDPGVAHHEAHGCPLMQE